MYFGYKNNIKLTMYKLLNYYSGLKWYGNNIINLPYTSVNLLNIKLLYYYGYVSGFKIYYNTYGVPRKIIDFK
jgi:hypothetical protein